MNKVHRPTERVVDILTIVSRYKEGMTFTDISNETNIPKGTLSPILHTLVDKKMLFLNSTTMQYRIGTKAFKIGYSFTDSIDIIKTIELKMKKIVDQCQEICQLGTLDGKNVLYMGKVEPIQSIRLESSVGKSFPAYATALGKCLLSRYDNDHILEMYKDGMEKMTDKTIDNAAKLIEEIDKVRKNNVAYEWGESNEQVMCIAVPIYYENKPILSISVSIPIYRVEKEKLKFIEEILLNNKEKIEKEIKFLEISNILI